MISKKMRNISMVCLSLVLALTLAFGLSSFSNIKKASAAESDDFGISFTGSQVVYTFGGVSEAAKTTSDDGTTLTSNFKTAQTFGDGAFSITASSSNMKLEDKGLKFQRTDCSISFTTNRKANISYKVTASSDGRGYVVSSTASAFATRTYIRGQDSWLETDTIENAEVGTYTITNYSDETIYIQSINIEYFPSGDDNEGEESNVVKTIISVEELNGEYTLPAGGDINKKSNLPGTLIAKTTITTDEVTENGDDVNAKVSWEIVEGDSTIEGNIITVKGTVSLSGYVLAEDFVAPVAYVSIIEKETLYSTRTISEDGLTSTWVHKTQESDSADIINGNGPLTDADLVYHTGRIVAEDDCWNIKKSAILYIPVPKNSSGKLSISGATRSNQDRYYTLSGDDTIYAPKSSPFEISFDENNIIEYESNYYLALTGNGGDLKPTEFKIDLTSGSYIESEEQEPTLEGYTYIGKISDVDAFAKAEYLGASFKTTGTSIRYGFILEIVDINGAALDDTTLATLKSSVTGKFIFTTSQANEIVVKNLGAGTVISSGVQKTGIIANLVITNMVESQYTAKTTTSISLTINGVSFTANSGAAASAQEKAQAAYNADLISDAVAGNFGITSKTNG